MRIVRYSPQQRVDTPDATAMSFLVLGEFRRFNRLVMLGPAPGSKQSDIRLIRGFKVEPQAVPDATVFIDMDPGGSNPFGAAFGAENLGARTESGQLMGGDDSAGNTEGNATVTLDFTPEAPGNYYVEMRFVYAEGANDNRAFWNEGTNSEFISATDTRFLPAWEAQISPAPTGGEWLLLALVTWDGVSIDAGDITDRRIFAFEGSALLPQSAAQDGFDGVGDFDRSTTRGDNGVNEVYPALKALARQVRDLKGQTSDGFFDWFSRPFAPPDPAGAGLPYASEHTKSLRTIDTVTYTIGNGTTTWGDFNGATALEELFDVIDGTGAGGVDRNRYIRIVIKDDGRAGVPFTLSKQWDFTGDGFVFIDIAGSTGSDSAFAGARPVVQATAVSLNPVIQCQGLRLENVALYAAVDTPLVDVAEIQCIDSWIANLAPAADSLSNNKWALKVDRASDAYRGVEIRRSVISGPVQITDSSSATAFTLAEGGVGAIIEDVLFTDAPLILHDQRNATNDRQCFGLTVRNCLFTNTGVTYTGMRGLIEANGNDNLIIEDVELRSESREHDMIHADVLTTSRPTRMRVRGCRFVQDDSSTRTSGVNAGANATGGTGWGIWVNNNSPTATNYDEHGFLEVTDCFYKGDSALSGAQDAGAFYVDDAGWAHIDSNTIWGLSAATGDTVKAIEVSGVTFGHYSMSNNLVSKFSDTTAGNYVGIDFSGANGNIDGNTLTGRQADEATDVSMNTGNSRAIAVSATKTSVRGNKINGWDEAQAGIRLTTCSYMTVTENTIQFVGANSLVAAYAIWCDINCDHINIDSNNIFATGAGSGINLQGSGTVNTEMIVTDNYVNATGHTGALNGIEWGVALSTGLCVGNRVNGLSIGAGGATLIFGRQNTSRNDLNYYP